MAPPSQPSRTYDAVIVGGGHNGLVAAAMLARAGRAVLVLERAQHVGGAAVSGKVFAGVDARLSRYSYLVSLLPSQLAAELGLGLPLRQRAVSSYTPLGDSGLLVTVDEQQTRASMTALAGDRTEHDRWRHFYAMLDRVAKRIAPTLTEPLRSAAQIRELVHDDPAWEGLFEQPLSELLQRTFDSDLVRGVVLTDATIGTFAPAADPELRQNRCFLYHVVGDGTGLWKVPVGGMGAVTDRLEQLARAAGAELRTGSEVTAIHTDGEQAEVTCADGTTYRARHVLANVAPSVLDELLGRPSHAKPEGSQLKINMLLSRLPRLRDDKVTSEQAFAGTFHANEGYQQLQTAYEQAGAGAIPSLPPCELYCHSLTDPTILSPELQAAGVQTLTLFGLHMPARLFHGDRHDQAKRDAVAATLASVNSVLAEPLEDCLLSAPSGEPCLEALTPVELEHELAMPGGHIFHRDLVWPFAQSDADVGRWGVETADPNVWICGAGARRGGGVSGIAGHNAARAVLAG
jgi:phytoene dehydrogenase-like protein